MRLLIVPKSIMSNSAPLCGHVAGREVSDAKAESAGGEVVSEVNFGEPL